MRSFIKTVAIFISTYALAYLWGTYDLETNLHTINSDGELATLGMMPIFLHLYAFGCALIAVLGYGLLAILKIIRRKIKRTADVNE
jgi:hypothetical protein